MLSLFLVALSIAQLDDTAISVNATQENVVAIGINGVIVDVPRTLPLVSLDTCKIPIQECGTENTTRIFHLVGQASMSSLFYMRWDDRVLTLTQYNTDYWISWDRRSYLLPGAPSSLISITWLADGVTFETIQASPVFIPISNQTISTEIECYIGPSPGLSLRDLDVRSTSCELKPMTNVAGSPSLEFSLADLSKGILDSRNFTFQLTMYDILGAVETQDWRCITQICSKS